VGDVPRLAGDRLGGGLRGAHARHPRAGAAARGPARAGAAAAAACSLDQFPTSARAAGGRVTMLQLSRIQSVGEAIRDATVTFKSNEALVEAERHRENGRWTYLQLRQQAERFAALLQGHGFEPGDRCAIVMQNQSKWIFSGLGAFWAGAVLVPIDYKLTAREQLELVAHCKPRVLVTEYGAWAKMQREQGHGDALERTLVLVTEAPEGAELGPARDRKSTRLNSSHVKISYAVFCL